MDNYIVFHRVITDLLDIANRCVSNICLILFYKCLIKITEILLISIRKM